MRNFLEENDHFTPSGVMEGIVIQRSNPTPTSPDQVGLGVEPIMDQVPINLNGIIARIVGVTGEKLNRWRIVLNHVVPSNIPHRDPCGLC
jgi:hypothetical protein